MKRSYGIAGRPNVPKPAFCPAFGSCQWVSLVVSCMVIPGPCGLAAWPVRRRLAHSSADAKLGGGRMSLTIRRVVTGHDPDGRAVVRIDEVCRNVISARPHHQSCVV